MNVFFFYIVIVNGYFGDFFGSIEKFFGLIFVSISFFDFFVFIIVFF